jgi:hypothetical protein
MQGPPRVFFAIAVIALMSACDSDGDVLSGGDVRPAPCEFDADCDDSHFCNGSERCITRLCAPGTPPCPTACSETADACQSVLSLEVEGFSSSLGAGCFAMGEPYTSAGVSVAVNTRPPPVAIGQAGSGQAISVRQSFRQDSTAAGGFGYSCVFAARLFADGVRIGSANCDTDSDQGVIACTATIDTTVP